MKGNEVRQMKMKWDEVGQKESKWDERKMINLLLFAGIEPTGTTFQTINNLLLIGIGGCFYDRSNLYSIHKIPAAAQRATASCNDKKLPKTVDLFI